MDIRGGRKGVGRGKEGARRFSPGFGTPFTTEFGYGQMYFSGKGRTSQGIWRTSKGEGSLLEGEGEGKEIGGRYTNHHRISSQSFVPRREKEGRQRGKESRGKREGDRREVQNLLRRVSLGFGTSFATKFSYIQIYFARGKEGY